MVQEYILYGLFGDGITITKNYINKNESENGYHGGIYLDQGTDNAEITYNVVQDCKNWIDARALSAQSTIMNTRITNNHSNTTPPENSGDLYKGRISAQHVENANTIYENNTVGEESWGVEASQIINQSGCKEKEPEPELIFTSEKYDIEENIIKHIQPNTSLASFKSYITNNSSYMIKEGDKIITETEKIKTGQVLIIGQTSYMLIVTGDVNKDGDSDIKDILAINKHRLNKSKLKDIYLIAGDVNNDNKADILDILKINKYRLKKINEL